MATVREHLKGAEDFLKAGIREYKEDRRNGDLMRVHESCERFSMSMLRLVQH